MWNYSSLVVLDEVGHNSLPVSRVPPRIEATSRDKIVVVVTVLQEKNLAKPRPCQYYQEIFSRNKTVRTADSEVGFLLHDDKCRGAAPAYLAIWILLAQMVPADAAQLGKPQRL